MFSCGFCMCTACTHPSTHARVKHTHTHTQQGEGREEGKKEKEKENMTVCLLYSSVLVE